MFRVQVGSEAADPILGGDNAISVLQIRDFATYFAVLVVLFVCASRGRVLWRVLPARRARALTAEWVYLTVHISWTVNKHAESVCEYVFRERKRECRLSGGSGT